MLSEMTSNDFEAWKEFYELGFADLRQDFRKAQRIHHEAVLYTDKDSETPGIENYINPAGWYPHVEMLIKRQDDYRNRLIKEKRDLADSSSQSNYAQFLISGG